MPHVGWLKTLDIHCLSPEAGSPRSRCQQAWVLLRTVREGDLPQAPLWFVDGHHLSAFSIWLLIYASLSVTKFLIYKDTVKLILGLF